MRYLAAGIVLLSTLVASSAYANEKWLEYIDWIVEHSDLTYNGEELPELIYMSYPLLEITVYGDQAVAQCEFQDGCTLPDIRGAYLDDTNQMVLPEGANLDDNEDVLVHETVHFLQYLGDVPECHQRLEKPAYQLHWQWVEEHDLQEKYNEPNWLFVYLLEMPCERYDYDYAR